jgi:hypothetical protein
LLAVAAVIRDVRPAERVRLVAAALGRVLGRRTP